MTTTEHHTNEIIDRARCRYLAANPPRINSVPAVDATTGQPVGEPFLLPNLSDMQIVGAKLGMEYLAICNDDEAVQKWIEDAMDIAKDPEILGILFANVFRGVNVVIGSMIDGAGARTRVQQLAVEAWGRDFSDFSDPEDLEPSVGDVDNSDLHDEPSAIQAAADLRELDETPPTERQPAMRTDVFVRRDVDQPNLVDGSIYYYDIRHNGVYVTVAGNEEDPIILSFDREDIAALRSLVDHYADEK
jgi:hypothetical protein